MAETFGSLIDKFTIKSIREFYIRKKIKNIASNTEKEKINEKLKILKKQKSFLGDEIESFIAAALKGKITLKDEKLKLYNKPEQVGKIGSVKTIAKAINALASKNMELWNLEDEARRQDVELKYIGEVKKKIDFANQQRNDLIDKIDDILEKEIKKYKK
jgi:hypothetical protein